MDRDEVVKQLERWTVLVLEEALALFDKGVSPTRLMATAITIADARLEGEIAARKASALAIPGTVNRFPKH